MRTKSFKTSASTKLDSTVRLCIPMNRNCSKTRFQGADFVRKKLRLSWILRAEEKIDWRKVVPRSRVGIRLWHDSIPDSYC